MGEEFTEVNRYAFRMACWQAWKKSAKGFPEKFKVFIEVSPHGHIFTGIKSRTEKGWRVVSMFRWPE